MQPVLDWLVHELQDPAKAGGGMLGSALVFIATVVFRVVRAERKRSEEEAKKVTPTVVYVPETKPDDIAMHRKVWELEQQVHDLRERLARTDKEKNVIAEDTVRIVQSLNQEQREHAESKRREEALKDELRELRDALDSSYTRLPLPKSRVNLRPINVTEISDEKTPDHRKKVRR